MDEKQTDLLLSAWNSIDDGVLMIDTEGKVIFVNQSYHLLPPKEIIGYDLVSKRPGAKLTEVMRNGMKQKYVLRKEGNQEYIISMYPIQNQEGETIGGISIGSSLDISLQNAEAISYYKNHISSLKRHIKDIQRAKTTFHDIVARDFLSLETKNMAQRVAAKEIDILLMGESGVGKELYAQAIHNASNRQKESFISLNCAALQYNLLESELFGYEEGSFTGAKKGGKIGLFEAAKGGTLFLDEISELNYDLQAKILRVLQERTVRRIGSTKEIPVDVRIIAATNVDLENLVAKGLFRKDLYYRIAIFPLNIPPLRERKEDIIPLVKKFLQHYENRVKRRIDLSPDVVQALLHYEWVGNVRELKNVIDYATAMMDGYTIELSHLPKRLAALPISQNKTPSKLKERLREIEKEEIQKALAYYGTSLQGKKQAAEALGISLASLYSKIAEYEKNS